MELDSYDRRILEILQSDGRLSNQELAERIGLSPSPCLRRVRALEEAGFRGRILPPVGADARVPGLIAEAILRGVPVCAGTCRWAGGQNP